MNREVSPAIVVVACLVVLSILTLLSLKILDQTNSSIAYVAGVKPPDLEKHINAPPGLRPTQEKDSSAKDRAAD